jgi:hypothetical protein
MVFESIRNSVKEMTWSGRVAILLCLILGLLQIGRAATREETAGLAPPALEFGLRPVTCASRFNTLPYSPVLISEALREVPGIQKQILEMMEDPLIPRQTKEIIQRSLSRPGIEVRNLTTQLRRAWEIPARIQAFAKLDSSRLERMSSETNPPQRIQHDLHGPEAVAVSDRPITGRENDLIALIHELAHLRLQAFLSKNADRLARRYSSRLIRREPSTGKFLIHSQFLDLLQERYAFESEYKAFRATHGRYFEDWMELYEDTPPRTTEQEMGQLLADVVIHGYGITDPEVVALGQRPLRELLLGGRRFAREFQDVSALIQRPLESVSQDEFKLAHALASRAMKKEEGFSASDAFERLLSEESGQAKAKAVLEMLLGRFEGTPGERVILDFLSDHSAMIGRKLDWWLPSSQPLTLEQAARTHPEIRGRLDKDPLAALISQEISKDDSNKITWEILRKKGQLGGTGIPRLSQGFSNLLTQIRNGVAASSRLQKSRRLYSTPLAKAAAGRNSFYKELRSDPAGLTHFWREQGLEKQFRARFPAPEKAWTSEKSIIDLYREFTAGMPLSTIP